MEIFQQIIVEFWVVLGEMAPYLLFGFIVAGILSVFISPELVEKNLGGGRFAPVFKASLLGIPLPLCSCGVIPVAASLHRHGANRAATTSFLLSTPQTGVDSILVTYSLLGPVFAIFRPVAALITGLLGGMAVGIMEKNGSEKEDLPAKCEAACCSTDHSHSKLYRAFEYGLVTLPRDIGRALIIGIAIAALIAFFLPDDFFSGLLGTGIWPMLVMMLGGIPLYVCATASVPIAAAMMMKGISAGAAFVFLVTGPATNAATIATIWKVLGKKTALIYLITVAVAALAGGMILNLLWDTFDFQMGGMSHWMLPRAINDISAVFLLIILGYAFYKSQTDKIESRLRGMEMKDAALQVKGMTCSHCTASVKRALEECKGVERAEVDLKTGKAYVQGQGLDLDELKNAVGKIGYSVVN